MKNPEMVTRCGRAVVRSGGAVRGLRATAAAHAEPLESRLLFAAQYVWTDLGTFGGRNSRAYDINDAGQVTGWAASVTVRTMWEFDFRTGEWVQRAVEMQPPNAFLYDSATGQMTDLGYGDEASVGWAINASGVVVGSVGSASNTERAFRLGLGPLDETEGAGFINPNIPASFAWDVNDAGEVVGHTYGGSGGTGFVYRNDWLSELRPPPEVGTPGTIRAISNGRVVVGTYELANTPSGQPRVPRAGAFHLDTGGFTELGTLATGATWTDGLGRPRPYESHAWDVNDAGDIVGQSHVDQIPGHLTTDHAFIYTDADGDGDREMIDLAPGTGARHSQAYAVNGDGLAVGRSSGLGAVLYADDNGDGAYDVLDLNGLVAARPASMEGWTLGEAHGINARGQIVGTAFDDRSGERAFLLTPVGAGVSPAGSTAGPGDVRGLFSPRVFPHPVTAAGYADLTGDGRADVADMAALADKYNRSFPYPNWTGGDIDLDRDVDIQDLEALYDAYDGGAEAFRRDQATFPPIANVTVPATGSATVTGRHVFYNNSAFDAGAAGDDGAIAAGTSALPAGGTPSAANVTSYSKGINGIMIDVAGLPAGGASLLAGDLLFRTGTTAWADAPAPTLSVRPGAGAGGADRIVLTWTDGAITNKWLQVTLPAGTKTGLAAADTFSFGNLVGDADGSRGVNLGDFGAVRQDFGRSNLAIADGRSDFNRDGSVNLADFGLLRGNFGGSLALPAVSPAGIQATDASAIVPAAAVPPPRKSKTVARAVLLAEEA